MRDEYYVFWLYSRQVWGCQVYNPESKEIVCTEFGDTPQEAFSAACAKQTPEDAV